MDKAAGMMEPLERFLDLTQALKQTIFDPESDPETWSSLFDQRQEVIEQLSALFAQGIALTDEQKSKYLKPAYEMDQLIVPMIEKRKRALEAEQEQFHKAKQANQQYVGYGASVPYGAFFDKRK